MPRKWLFVCRDSQLVYRHGAWSLHSDVFLKICWNKSLFFLRLQWIRIYCILDKKTSLKITDYVELRVTRKRVPMWCFLAYSASLFTPSTLLSERWSEILTGLHIGCVFTLLFHVCFCIFSVCQLDDVKDMLCEQLVKPAAARRQYTSKDQADLPDKMSVWVPTTLAKNNWNSRDTHKVWYPLWSFSHHVISCSIASD